MAASLATIGSAGVQVTNKLGQVVQSFRTPLVYFSRRAVVGVAIDQCNTIS